MAQLAITNVINISVSESPTGLGEYNTSNLAIFTPEASQSSFGSDPYKIYLEPLEVGADFGTDSKVYSMALEIFSQKPNILQGGGYLVVIPMVVESQSATPSLNPTAGTYILNFGGDATAAIDWDATADEIQAAVRTLTGLEQAVVTGTLATHLNIVLKGFYGPAALLTVTSNTLTASATPVTLPIAQIVNGETYAEAIVRASPIVQFFGLMLTEILGEDDTLDSAIVVESLNKISGVVQRDPAAVEVGGIIDLITQNSYTQTRGLFYGASDDVTALSFLAAYFGRALSVNFNGSNTTLTMQLKTLIGVVADPSMTQTLFNKCKAAGADTYCSIQGVAKVMTSGANKFFDQVYNLRWFVGALQVAGFNYLATTSTKIPQTEDGMRGLNSAYRKVCQQGVTNKYMAPGIWNSPITFGNQQDLFDNVAQIAYYIYSQPVSEQSPTDRNARKAPLFQLAIKEAGAAHESDVIVNVNS